MKFLFTLILLTVFTFVLHTQENAMPGEWLLYQAVQPGKTVEPYLILDFTDDGTIQLYGIDFGTWKFNPEQKKLVLKSEMEPDFNGDANILRFDKDTLIIKLDTVQFSFAKLNQNRINQQNQQSKLQGLWKINGYDNFYMKFGEPDEFLSVNNNDGSLTTYRGKWLYNPADSSLIVISFFRDLKGKSFLRKITNKEFEILNSGKKFLAEKVDTSKFNIEKLNFAEEDFDEDDDYSDKLPWNDFDLMKEQLSGIKQLVYRSGYLITDLNILFYKTELKYVKVNTGKGRVTFVNKVINGRDTMQFSERYRDNLTNSFNPFFPENDPMLFRVTGKEDVYVPAGKFKCTVVEAVDGDKKLKYWMIDDLPGVYAKIISQQQDTDGKIDYHKRELVKIIR